MNKNIALVSEVTEWYINQFPSRDEIKLRKVGIEKEYPVVDGKTYKAGDVRKIFPVLAQMGWIPTFDDVYYKVISSVTKDGIEITTDGGWCTLEIIMPPEKSILTASEKLQTVEKLIARLCSDHGMRILGYGIQPITTSRPRLWAKKGRYDAIQKALPRKVNRTVITASDQLHIDIAQEEIVDSINVFNALSGPIIYLFSHSPIWNNRIDAKNRCAVREDVWSSFVDENRTSIPPQPFTGIEEFIWHMLELPFLISQHKNKYVVPNIPFAQWMKRHDNWRDQWKFHEGSVWFNARPKTIFSTLEVRPVCSQKSGKNAYLAALIIGLMGNLFQAKKLVEKHSWEQWHQLKKDAIYGKNTELLKKICEDMLKIALNGIIERGMGEEILIALLTQRLYGKTPAQEAIESFESGGIPGLVNSVAIPI